MLVGDTFFLHQLIDRRQRTHDLRAIGDCRRQPADISRGFDAIVGRWIIRNLFRHADEAQRAIGHVFESGPPPELRICVASALLTV